MELSIKVLSASCPTALHSLGKWPLWDPLKTPLIMKQLRWVLSSKTPPTYDYYA